MIQYQIIKSATSVAANFRASTRARSKAEFYSKICIVVEEADETQFWLELLDESGLADKEVIKQLHKESSEILAIVTKIKSSLNNDS